MNNNNKIITVNYKNDLPIWYLKINKSKFEFKSIYDLTLYLKHY